MGIADEARAEAETRWPTDNPRTEIVNSTYQDEFVAGAEWQASRKPEAAPSDTDCEHDWPMQIADGDPCLLWCGATRGGSQPVQADPREVAHIECDCVPDLGPSHCHLCGERAGHPVPWSEAHPAQPVQVEVTDEEREARIERGALEADLETAEAYNASLTEQLSTAQMEIRRCHRLLRMSTSEIHALHERVEVTEPATSAVWCYCYGTPEPDLWVFPDDEHADTCGFDHRAPLGGE